MNEQKNTSNNKFTEILHSSLIGLLVGFFNCIPFLNSEDMKETLHFKESGFSTYWSKTIPYILFATIAGTLFYFAPVDYLMERYKTGIYSGVGLMALIFLISEIYKAAKIKPNKTHIISSSIVLICTLAISIGMYFIKFPDANAEYIQYLIAIYLLINKSKSSIVPNIGFIS